MGPDLSNVARGMRVDEIREAVLQPSAHITRGYQLVSVRLRDGKTLRGFARGRSKFDVQLQDLEGRFHLLQEGQILSVEEEKESPMRPLRASSEELQNLIAYLSRLTGVKSGVARIVDGHPEADGVDFARIENPKPYPQGWPYASPNPP